MMSYGQEYCDMNMESFTVSNCRQWKTPAWHTLGRPRSHGGLAVGIVNGCEVCDGPGHIIQTNLDNYCFV